MLVNRDGDAGTVAGVPAIAALDELRALVGGR